MKKSKGNPFEGKGQILINGEPLNDENRSMAKLVVTDGFIRAAYGMRDTGQLSERLNEILHCWSYTSPITGEVYGK